MNHLVRTTISQSMPIDLDAHQIDYKVLQEFREDGIDKIKVFVTAVLKSIIQSYIDILIELGLKPYQWIFPPTARQSFSTGRLWFPRVKRGLKGKDPASLARILLPLLILVLRLQ